MAVGEHGNDDPTGGAQLLQRRRDIAGHLGAETLDRGWHRIGHREAIARCGQPESHGRAHVAQSDEADALGLCPFICHVRR